MTRSLAALLAAFLVCPALAGCLHPAGPPCCCATPVPCGTSCATLATIERGHIEAGGETPSAPPNPSVAPGPFVYRALAVLPCQCLAVQNAATAQLLDLTRQGVAEEAAQRHWLLPPNEHQTAGIKQSILFNASQEIRNRNAGAALELYYHLAEAEATADLVEQSLGILRDLSHQFQEMKNKGLRLPIDYDALARRQIDVQIQQAQVQQAINQLNSDLSRLLGIRDCAPEVRLWPSDDFKIPSQAVDIESAVTQGVRERPELVLLREAEQKLDLGTLPAIRQLTQSFHPLLGLLEQQPRWLLATGFLRAALAGRSNCVELEVRRQQLRYQREHRERAVAEDIRQAGRTLAAHQQLIALSREKAASWEKKVHELEDRNKQGLASVSEVALGKLDWLRARGELVKEVMAWHIAYAKFRQAQGILARECSDFVVPGACTTWDTREPWGEQ